MQYASLHDAAPQRGRAVRMDARSGRLTTPTAGLAAGNVQANLAILPADLAADFLLFCQRNPRACPLLAMSEPGDPSLPELGQDIDIRTDLPRYRVWRDGELVQEPTDVRDVWRDDLVSFLIGCSFSFEEALLSEGIEIRHIACQTNAPMWRCNIPTRAAGPFSGPLVVSMRPFKAADAIRAIQVTSRFPSVHGAPVHIGMPEEIGITNIDQPEYGSAVPVGPGELPVFWACGVTPQAVVEAAELEFCITHAPAHMLVTDLRNSDFAVL